MVSEGGGRAEKERDREKMKGNNLGCTHSTPHTIVTSYTGTSWINMGNIIPSVDVPAEVETNFCC
jgi:hypothetical protein